MIHARKSRSTAGRAFGARTVIVALLALRGVAGAQDAESQITLVPAECSGFWTVLCGPMSPARWEAMLSFAACSQDASVHRIERADQLETFVEQLHTALGPSLHYYVIAIEDGPTPIKLRAAYAIAIGQVALMTRARESLAAPALRDRLEQLLDPHARLAHLLFTAIYQDAAEDPALAPDAVTRYMVRSSRTLATELRKRWATARDPAKPCKAACD